MHTSLAMPCTKEAANLAKGRHLLVTASEQKKFRFALLGCPQLSHDGDVELYDLCEYWHRHVVYLADRHAL